MGVEDRGSLSFTKQGYAIRLELVDPTYRINSNGQQELLQGVVRRNQQINRFGKNFEPNLSKLTTRSKTIEKQVQATNQLHGDVLDDRFPFIADNV
ncbi:MAG: hypothetical protein ACW99G_07170 [Candidatus Thorarchaeota archaeon]